jgi:hypothetical protein
MQLTQDDLTSLEVMLNASGAGGQADITWAVEQTGGLGLFNRSLVGVDRQAATGGAAPAQSALTLKHSRATSMAPSSPSTRCDS